MKKIILRKFITFTLSALLFCTPLLAHSGRTDASGGHKDNKNKSGLGSYHYHCGEYPAHLHQGGACPYDDNQTSNTSHSATASAKKSTPTYSIKKQNMSINGANEKIDSILVENVNLVEMKALCESLGVAIQYDSETKSLLCTKGANEFLLQIDSTNFWKDGELSTLITTPIAYNGRTFVPARVVAEAIGKTVTYDATKDIINIQ